VLLRLPSSIVAEILLLALFGLSKGVSIDSFASISINNHSGASAGVLSKENVLLTIVLITAYMNAWSTTISPPVERVSRPDANLVLFGYSGL